MDRTFAIIKPDAVAAKKAGGILARIEKEGFAVRAMRLMHLTKGEAEGFYAVHKARPFFGALTDFMSSGPCIVMALEAPDAIGKWRTLMGATDPAKAEAGTPAQGVRRVDRAQRDARLRRARDGRLRARLLLPRPGVLALTGAGRWAAAWSSSASSSPASGWW